jgi:NADH:ubiquinone oxidoreductase subunit E
LSLTIFEGSSGGGIDLARVNAILDRYTEWNANEALIPMLQEIQHEFGFVPDVTAALILDRFGVPLEQTWGVSTFYSDFKVRRKAAHRILLCEGTACYVCGSQELARTITKKLGIDYNEVTPDRKWILERANFCFGACQLMPVVEIDHTIYGNVTPERLIELIDEVGNSPAHEGEH